MEASELGEIWAWKRQNLTCCHESHFWLPVWSAEPCCGESFASGNVGQYRVGGRVTLWALSGCLESRAAASDLAMLLPYSLGCRHLDLSTLSSCRLHCRGSKEAALTAAAAKCALFQQSSCVALPRESHCCQCRAAARVALLPVSRCCKSRATTSVAWPQESCCRQSSAARVALCVELPRERRDSHVVTGAAASAYICRVAVWKCRGSKVAALPAAATAKCALIAGCCSYSCCRRRSPVPTVLLCRATASVALPRESPESAVSNTSHCADPNEVATDAELPREARLRESRCRRCRITASGQCCRVAARVALSAVTRCWQALAAVSPIVAAFPFYEKLTLLYFCYWYRYYLQPSRKFSSINGSPSSSI
jgi:hypothetical protein